MSNVTIQKRGNFYQYKFEVAKVEGKRKFINKSGFETKDEAIKAGNIAYTEYLNTGLNFKENTISFSDYLDYWYENYCEVNLKYNTRENFYISSTDENKKDVSNVYDNLINSKTINDIIKYEIG